MDIKYKSQFIEYFSKGIKNQNNLKIGVEHERFLFEGENKKRISYETLKKLFENLKVNGWEPLYEKENIIGMQRDNQQITTCLLYTSPSPRDGLLSRMPSSA